MRINFLLMLLVLPAWNIPANESFSFTTKILLEPGVNSGKNFKLWAPYPVENNYQVLKKIQFKTRYPHKVTTDKKYKNRFVYISGDWPRTKDSLSIIFHVIRKKDHGFVTGKSMTSTVLSKNIFKLPNRLVPHSPLITSMAIEAVKNSRDSIRSLFDYTVDLISYDKSGKGWGNGDAVWVCDAKRGNCTDFHSLYIGMARALNIPARFEMGFSLPVNSRSAQIKGYHCWARVYSPARGWIPLDASEAKKAEVKKTAVRNDFYGSLPPDRIQFSTGRDIILNPPQKGGPLNYYIYPYAEIGGKPISLNSTFYYQKGDAKKIPTTSKAN